MEEAIQSSVWKNTAPRVTYPALVADRNVDICIVGAGIVGITTAYLLLREGKSVMVLDDGPIGWGETGHTTGHLCTLLDDRYFYLADVHGEDKARLAAESHAAAVDLIESIVKQEKIDCDFERLDGYLFVPKGDSPEPLKDELRAARAAGLDVEWQEHAPFRHFETGPSLRCPRQGQFHSLKYLAALTELIHERGAAIHTGTHVENVESGAPARVITATGAVVTAGAVIVATNVPMIDRMAMHTKQEAYRTYVIGGPIAEDELEHALYWDTLDPYHYVRLQHVRDESGERQLLLIGGEDHKTGQDEDERAHFDRLEAWARERFPSLGELEYRWSGQIIEPLDGLAFIGRNPGDDNIYIATGDSGNGLTHGTIAAMMFRDFLTGRDNPWRELYDPSRKVTGEIKEYMRATLNVARQYGDYLTPGEVDSEADIAPGCGAIMRSGLNKIAVYRDEHGAVYKLSAVCPHLGCLVRWNNASHSWDCPCHGSRFEATGKLLNGPANKDLSTLKEEVNARRHRG